MSKFKIGQRVKIIGAYPYSSNTTGVITSSVDNSYYYVYLDEKFHFKEMRMNCYIIRIDCKMYTYAYYHPIIHEKNLILINRNLDNE